MWAESGVIQALAKTGMGGRATRDAGHLPAASRAAHAIRNADGKSVTAVKAGSATARKVGALSAAGRIGGLAAKASGQLLAAAKAGGKAAGQLHKAAGTGVCGFSKEERAVFASLGGIAMRGTLWWVHPETGKCARAVACPPGYVRGRRITRKG